MSRENSDIRYNLSELPAWEPKPHSAGVGAPPLGKVWWSGKGAPPKIGDRVDVAMNGFGPGTVRGYFVEWGWLGIYVEVDNPPEWYVKQLAQDGARRPANREGLPMIFGAELREVKA